MARCRRSSTGTPRISVPSSALASVVRQGESASRASMYAMSRLPITGGFPPTRNEPLHTSAGSSPAAKFNSVVLPQPLGPTIETNSPGLTLSETRSTASTPTALNSTDTVSRWTAPRSAWRSVGVGACCMIRVPCPRSLLTYRRTFPAAWRREKTSPCRRLPCATLSGRGCRPRGLS